MKTTSGDRLGRPCAAGRLLAVAVFVLSCGASALEQHITRFTGVWRFQAEKSSFDPGPAFRSFTLTFAPDGSRHLDLTFADGRRLRAVLPWSDGRLVEVRVLEGGGAGRWTAVSRIRGSSVRDTWYENGRVIEQVRGRISPDGRTLTMNVEGPLPDGRRFRNRVVFERQ